MTYIQHYESPLGGILLAADEIGLTGLWFDGQKCFARDLSGERVDQETPALTEARRWLDIYFTGKEPDFLPPLHPTGSEFRKAVWEILLQIPYGQTTTYGEIARQLAEKQGLARMSAQAVGGAVGHNKISIIIPCHRVVGSDGNLTGFASGLRRKFRLLALEGLDMSRYPLPPPRGGSDLRRIPGVGANIEEDLFRIGIRNVADLAGEDPEQLYRDDCAVKKFQEDRC